MMNRKEYIRLWHESVQKYKDGRYQECINLLRCIVDPCSRICYNMACVYMKLERRADALRLLTRAVTKDTHLAIGFFQRGALHFEMGNLCEARHDLDEARRLMKGNPYINYRPLGLLTILHLPLIQHNLAVVSTRLGSVDEAMSLLTDAQLSSTAGFRQKHDIQYAIDVIKTDQAHCIAPLTISTDVIFTPSKTMVAHLHKKTFATKAKVICAANVSDTATGFDGPKRVEELKNGQRSTAKSASNNPISAIQTFFSRSPSPESYPSFMKGSKSSNDLTMFASAYKGSKPYRQSAIAHALSASCSVLTAVATSTSEPLDDKSIVGRRPIRHNETPRSNKCNNTHTLTDSRRMCRYEDNLSGIASNRPYRHREADRTSNAIQDKSNIPHGEVMEELIANFRMSLTECERDSNSGKCPIKMQHKMCDIVETGRRVVETKPPEMVTQRRRRAPPLYPPPPPPAPLLTL